MDTNGSVQSLPRTLGQCFSDNLSAVLAVAGEARDNHAPGAFSAVRMQRRTGIARSTLRALKSAEANPDLSTISRLADALGVPPAFLLMRPEDWEQLAAAIGDSGDYLAAADKLLREERLEARNPVEKVLRECKVHPDARPIGVGASPEVSRVNARDEWRRRSCLKFDALMLRQTRAPRTRVMLTAIAGALVSRATPHNPSNDQ
ncbi:MAG: helix-turn-helix domain-containing protein [Pseudomonas protegens]|uniref:helix-turn-helix domain-containing protein n=1 Tax=Pseudomonas protegens TaxID=380021 RepID=UPI00383AC82D